MLNNMSFMVLGLSVSLWIVACVPVAGPLGGDEPDEGRPSDGAAPDAAGGKHDQLHRTEARPEEAAGDAHKRGAVDCSQEVATGYTSGSPFDIKLVRVDGKPVEIDTANAYSVMQRDAAADGVSLRVVSGFRSQGEQRYLYNCYLNCNCNNCNLAAAPGYSNHQSGYALDLNTADAGVYRWLANNAGRYGFRRTVPSEDWHWEYFGGAPEGGVCSGLPGGSANGLQASVAMSFKDLNEGGWYRNGLWLKVQADGPVHHVRYLADGYLMGSSENREDDFSLRYTFGQLGDRRIVARAYDDNHRQIGEVTINVKITEGESRRAQLSWSSFEDGGWYRNGQWMRVDADDAIERVAYFAGAQKLGESAAGDDRFGLRVAFFSLGYRVLLAVGYDAQGEEVARNTVLVRFLPGADPAPRVVLLSPTPGSRVSNGLSLTSMASDGVSRVDYRVDGHLLGSSTDQSANFPISYTFSQTGERQLVLEAYDAQGDKLVESSVKLTIF